MAKATNDVAPDVDLVKTHDGIVLADRPLSNVDMRAELATELVSASSA